jgi:hypothetical protein
MPIIATKDGLNVNPAHVVQYEKLRNGQTKMLLVTGGEIRVETYQDDIGENFISVIPANPGFVAVFAERWGDGVFQYKPRSVVAWRLCPSGNYPIFEGYNGEEDDYQVMIDPAGGAYDSDRNLYSTLDEWKECYEAEENGRPATLSKVAA